MFRGSLGNSRRFHDVAKTLLKPKQHWLSDSDLSRLKRKLMEVEIKVLDHLLAGDESRLDHLPSEAPTETVDSVSPTAMPGELMSALVEKYLQDTARDSNWPPKTVIRKRGELREFTKIAGDKPVNAYEQKDGVRFVDVQRALPNSRQIPPFKGLSLVAAADKASQLLSTGSKVDLLNPITINDKVGTVYRFFDWAHARDASVVNPAKNLRIRRSKKGRVGTKRQPWNVDELNTWTYVTIRRGASPVWRSA